ncbi:MAG: penicillin acylase family protein [Rhodobacteraceae bacterium]|nr:penicillin acylase family protein [Paracoccaceae bacterium]MCP5340785.1 penicillin acylase family protein [Paracoccaceae bacterium]
MINAFRWLLRIFLGIATLIAAVLGLGYYFAARSLPDYDEDFTVGGIDSPVEIVRDTADIPHIFAAGDAGVFFGLGFAHAQDRLWQMTVMRRTAQGRLSEIFGAQTLPTDDLMRRLDIYGAASASLAAQDDDTLAALKAYADGVNAWISLINSEAKGRGAPEFFLFSNEISYWQPVDSIALLKLMALKSSSQMTLEIRRARLSLLSSDWASDLMPEVPGNGVAALPPFASLVPGVRPSYAALSPAEAFSPVPQAAFAGASNAWAAAPARSVANGSLIANDPHVDFSAPGLFYLARLDLESGGVIGASIPGIPAILAGRNNGLGWAISGAWLDDQDIFIEELDPADGERYRTPQGWKPFVSRRSIIDVKDSPPVTITLRWSENGPILPGTHLDLASVTPPGHVAALAWTGLDANDRSMSAVMKLMRAHSVSEGLAAGEGFVAPAQNVTMADQKDIAMVMFGTMPARNPDQRGQGRLPSLGWEPGNRWQGTLPYANNPRFVDPAGGIVGNTNNKTVDRPFPLHVTFNWGDSQRVQRWTQLMQEREVHSRDSFIAVQLDTTSPAARTILPLIAGDLWFTGEAAPAGSPEELRQRALDLLAKWDGNMNEHLPEPLIYAAWVQALQNRLIRDELGPLADSFTHVEPLFIERVYRDIDGAGSWCNVMQSATQETCTDMARLSLDDALLMLSEKYGRNVESWRWGDAHQALHDHEVLGRMPFLKWVVNIHQTTSGGDQTLNRGVTKGTAPDPFANVNGAGYRGVYDLADPDSSVFIIPTGQSGHPLSRHYDDLSEIWRRGEYVPMSLDPDLARAAATGITVLTPQAAP